ncbi:MAG: hypothetical protein HYS18_14870 [Burkholderiales bacterium]|nr:hypothetical protein [Burkholderiales bacterium]
MSTLHGILTELGIERPALHADPEFMGHTDWISDLSFHPLPGHIYEVAFGQSPITDRDDLVIKRVRTDAASPGQWVDADTAALLPSSLREMPIVAFRALD